MASANKQAKQDLLNKLYEPHRQSPCNSPLYISGCTNIVFGEGNADANLLFIGEAPGKNEDEQGRPFVGRSGKLLTQILNELGLKREDVFITNIVKCRPPNNRTPSPKEQRVGKETMLLEQIRIIDPTIICTLGSPALNGLLETSYPIGQARGKPIEFQNKTILPAYHPAYILRNPSARHLLREDISKAIDLSQKIQS